MLSLLPTLWWPLALLALVLATDVVLSLRPAAFILECLDGVRFPREWSWILIVIKLLAIAGLVVGIWVPGVAVAANIGVVAYFCCAAAAHLRARDLGRAFWINCLGMLTLSSVVLVLSITV